MTLPTSSPQPAGPHPSVDELADLAEGLVEDPAAAGTLRAHLADCTTCHDTLADLAEVQQLLGELETPAMPADVADRLDAALAALTTEADHPDPAPGPVAAPGAAPRPGGAPAGRTPTGGPHTTGPRTAGPPPAGPAAGAPPRGPGRSHRSRRILLGTAAALVAVTFGALLLRTPGSGTADSTAAGASAASPAAPFAGTPGATAPKSDRPRSAAGAQPALGAAGPDYREATLPAQIQQLVGAAGGPVRPGQGSVSATATAPPCAPSVAAALLATDHGSFEGTPVDVLVYAVPGDTDRLDVYLVDSACPASPSPVLLHRTVAAH
ncbi:hypothetical protein [Kitasatospora sp. NBC_00315]|uniref:hypothetical protein n=1 Tax=Kitasatospora sp. NBC_00315 TaxID=2975963 RepID=UPI003246CC4B